ncbi:hypothetical protein AUJ69_03440 [Candidatus Woesearchaeota archaeon CG1_02_47_18]|nr:MAG: hypothetical protein AUJ69_03440 [Candidatus Woesearchaeota archaeon CG1_02_47_18]
MRIEKKIWPELFQAIVDGKRNFELGRADTECSPDDVLVLREWDPNTKQYTGRVLEKRITYVLKIRDVISEPGEAAESALQLIGLEANSLDMIQNRIRDLFRKLSLEEPPEDLVLDLVSDVGTVSKEILEMTNHGKKPLSFRSEARARVGEAFYSLVTVANALNIDLNAELEKAIEMREKHI